MALLVCRWHEAREISWNCRYSGPTAERPQLPWLGNTASGAKSTAQRPMAIGGNKQTQSHSKPKNYPSLRPELRNYLQLLVPQQHISWIFLSPFLSPRNPKPKAGRSCMFMPPWKTIMVPSCWSLQYMPMTLARMQMITWRQKCWSWTLWKSCL